MDILGLGNKENTSVISATLSNNAYLLKLYMQSIITKKQKMGVIFYIVGYKIPLMIYFLSLFFHDIHNT